MPAFDSGMGDLHVLDWREKAFRTNHQTTQDGSQIDIFLNDADPASVVRHDFERTIVPRLDLHITTQTARRTELDTPVTKREKRIPTLVRKRRRRVRRRRPARTASQ